MNDWSLVNKTSHKNQNCTSILAEINALECFISHNIVKQYNYSFAFHMQKYTLKVYERILNFCNIDIFRIIRKHEL